MITNPCVEQRHKFLIDANVTLLQQALELLGRCSDGDYTASPPRLPGQRIAGHIRHVVEFYECFMAGLRCCRIDYDARRRDSQLEVDRGAAILRIRALIQSLTTSDALLKHSTVLVRIEDAAGASLDHDFVESSVGRELQALSSHTVHHFGLIAILARLLGIRVDDNFGFAPSTLRYRAAQGAEAA